MRFPRVFVLTHFPLGGGFFAINLFGLIFAKRPLTPVELNHERIHSRQQRELLYIPFFVWYVAEWLLFCVKLKNPTAAYFRIRFEREAYRHERDLDYLRRRRLWAVFRRDADAA